MTFMAENSDKKQIGWVKENKCFICKEKTYTAYDCPKKSKILAISERVSKDNNC